MNKRYVLIALMMLVLAALACNRTKPTPTPPAETIAPTLPVAGGTTIPSATPQPGVTPSPQPGVTPSPIPPTPTQGTPECVYDADFVSDVTIPDDTELDPETDFVKTWRVRNSGTCAWEEGAAWVFVSGEKLGGPDSVNVSVVEPGDTVDISVNFSAPQEPGEYSSYWKMRRPNGELFGTRSYVRIIVPSESTPTPTATTAPTSEPGTGPTIVYFRADVDEADPGDAITLSWETKDVSSVVLYHLQPTGELGDSWEGLDTSGTFEYEIGESERNHTSFILYAYDDGGHIVQETLFIPLNCPDTWFFTPAPDSCPSGPAITFVAAEEHFQHGAMLWIDGQDLIYVLFDDGQDPHWSVYTDEWEEGDPQDNPNLTPPSGLYQPARGFGLVWREQPGVRDRLGWATDAEVGFDTAVQRTSRPKYNDIYIRALDGGVWVLFSGSSGWEKLP